jgi:NAD(P)H dehydrogenase (quinone)
MEAMSEGRPTQGPSIERRPTERRPTERRPTALVIGATGAIGGALVRELLADPGPDRLVVRAAVRRPEAAAPLREQGAEVAALDLDGVERQPLGQSRVLADAVAGVDRLFLLTGYSVDMLVQSKAVLDAARAAGVQHVVHLGAWATDDTTIVHLGWHQLVERYVEWGGFRFTHLRPNVFMQNILRFGLREGGVIHQFTGDAPVSWIDTDDVAAAAAAILRAPAAHHGKTYPLAVEALSVGQVAEVLTDVIGRRFRYQPGSPDEWLAGALAAGMDPAYARCVHNVFRRTAEGSLGDAADVFDSFQAITGREPIRWRHHAARHRDEFLRRAPA